MSSNKSVNTYHCTFCSHFLVATTLDLASLPRRQGPGLDGAIIVPLPPPPRNPADSEDEEDEDSDTEIEEEIIEEDVINSQSNEQQKQPAVDQENRTTEESSSSTQMDPQQPQPRKRIKRILPPLKDYTLVPSSSKDRGWKIIVREDGFEKRYLWRCGRCRVIIGYQLDDMHYPSEVSTAGGSGEAPSQERGGTYKKKRKKRDYIYFLPGALISTEELGRDINETEAEFAGLKEKESN